MLILEVNEKIWLPKNSFRIRMLFSEIDKWPTYSSFDFSIWDGRKYHGQSSCNANKRITFQMFKQTGHCSSNIFDVWYHHFNFQ